MKRSASWNSADAVFGAEVNDALLYEAVRPLPGVARTRRHAQDQGAARSRGSGKKLWKQKGTGRARR